jgi:hypothetical protein
VRAPRPSRTALSSWTTSRYQEYVERFRSIFSASPPLPFYYLPGNHDVGLGDGRDTSTFARSRYRAAFGPLAQHVVLGGHSLLMVDAPALVDEDWRREQAGESRFDGLPQDLHFLKHMRMQHTPGTRSFHPHTDDFFNIILLPDAPLILLSHIPLYRFPNSSCGPLRERGSIPAVRGNGYQTQLSLETSRMLLEEFRPSLIFRYFYFPFFQHHHMWPTHTRTAVMTTTTVNIPTPLAENMSPR